MVRGAVQDEGESSPERDGFDGLVDAVIDGLQQLLLFLCQGSLRTEVLLAQFGCLLFFGDDGVLALCVLGGGQYVLIGNVIESQFLTSGNWSFGSALSLIMVIIIMISMYLTRKIDRNGGDEI